jgi:hypothetical protein
MDRGLKAKPLSCEWDYTHPQWTVPMPSYLHKAQRLLRDYSLWSASFS